jgi:DegV family protein with EDD domain
MNEDIQILTDSTADLPADLCQQLNIQVIPMYLTIEGKTYKDGEDIDAGMLFEKVEASGHYPKTSAPSLGDFLTFFNRKGKSIYISVSSQLSTTFKNAQLAVKELGEITIDVIDSLSISSGYGQVVLKAAQWRDQGMGFEELGHRIRELVKQSRGIFILDTLDYLYHGGRCSAIQNFVSSLLKIRPFLNIRKDGTLGVLQKVGGSRMKAVKTLCNYFKEHLEEIDLEKIIIAHLDCEDEVNYLKEHIMTLGRSIEIMTSKVGCVLATHSGPKPLGIAYLSRG